MSKTHNQLDLKFDRRIDILPALKAALADALKRSRLSRDEVVDRVNESLKAAGLAGELTVPTLNKWAAPSDSSHKPDLQKLLTIMAVLDDPAPLAVMAGALGLDLAGTRERQLMALGEAQLESRRASKKRAMAMALLEEIS